MNLAGYIRVSTEGQVDAFGKDVQRDAIVRWARLNGHTVTHFYEEDGVSGKTDSGDRPALLSLIEQAERKRFEGMVAFDATRLARRLVVQETLLELIRGNNLRVFTTTAGELSADDDDPTRILVRQILGVIAEFDHRNTVKRLHDGRRAKIRGGGYAGGVTAYGVDVVGSGRTAQLVDHDVESKVVEQIKELHSRGYSLRYIAEELNRSDIGTKKGKRWAATQIQRIIKRHENT